MQPVRQPLMRGLHAAGTTPAPAATPAQRCRPPTAARSRAASTPQAWCRATENSRRHYGAAYSRSQACPAHPLAQKGCIHSAQENQSHPPTALATRPRRNTAAAGCPPAGSLCAHPAPAPANRAHPPARAQSRSATPHQTPQKLAWQVRIARQRKCRQPIIVAAGAAN